jgi:hypothetical protein
MTAGWKCLARDQVWVNDNLLPDSVVDMILNSWKDSAEYQEVAQAGMKYLVTPTNYHYNGVTNKIAQYDYIQNRVLTEMNEFYPAIFGKAAPVENLSYMQYFMKTAVPNVSFYDLHSEPSIAEDEHFGDAVFMLYLSDEVDGEIVFPSESDAQPHVTPAYEETLKVMSVDYVPTTVSITPKKNRCVVLRTGTPHYVNICSGERYCISGMSFADGSYKDRWKSFDNK